MMRRYAIWAPDQHQAVAAGTVKPVVVWASSIRAAAVAHAEKLSAGEHQLAVAPYASPLFPCAVHVFTLIVGERPGDGLLRARSCS